MVLGSVDIMLIAENADSYKSARSVSKIHLFRALGLVENSFNAPNCHAGTRDTRKLDGARETLVTLGIVVLEADLELDSLEEVSLLFVVGIIEQ